MPSHKATPRQPEQSGATDLVAFLPLDAAQIDAIQQHHQVRSTDRQPDS
ncbi:MAG: hypothetical protein U0796_00230 [Gemmatales bacterium]